MIATSETFDVQLDKVSRELLAELAEEVGDLCHTIVIELAEEVWPPMPQRKVPRGLRRLIPWADHNSRVAHREALREWRANGRTVVATRKIVIPNARLEVQQ